MLYTQGVTCKSHSNHKGKIYSIINTKIKMRKKSKCNTKESQRTGEESKRRKKHNQLKATK